MKKNQTRRALLLSALSLLLCVSMLVGTTFAWFTDSVTSASNIIKSGKLDVEMYWADGTKAVPTEDSGWTDASKGAIFNYSLWEPGYTQVRHIKIANKGTLALKYKVNIIPNGEVSKLADVIDVYYMDPADQVADRTELTDSNKLGTLTQVLGKLGETGNGELTAGDSDTITIAFKMQESAGNEYQNLAIGTDFSVQLLATQLTYEEDSFNNLYDKDALYPVLSAPVDIPEDSTEAKDQTFTTDDSAVNAPAEVIKDIADNTSAKTAFIEHAEPIIKNNMVIFGYFDLVDENKNVIDLEKMGNTTPLTVTVDLNGAFANGETVVVYHDGEAIASAVVTDGKITYTTTHFCEIVVAYNDGKINSGVELEAAISNGGRVELEGNVVLTETIAIPAETEVTLDLNGNQLTFAGTAGEYAISNEGATLTINGGEFEGVIYTAPSSKTIVNGGTFRARQGEKYVFLNNQGTLEFNGGTVYGGTSYPIYSYNANNKLVINDVVVNASFGCINAYGLGGVVEINGGTFEMTGVQGKTSHIAYFSNVDVTVNGGNFNKIGDINMSATGGGGVCVIYGADVTVNGGVFNGDYEDIYNWGGTNANGRANKIALKGGTFSVKPNASFVAPGYQVTNNGDGTYTVGAYKVSTGAELVDAIANGKAVELTQDVKLGKIDLTGAITNDVVINANGHKITTTDAYGIEVTAGKNVTISNADVEMTKEGNYITYAAGFKIANGDYAGSTITLKNCTITMANTDWAYAVTMPASVKNLNLVIDNCTLEGAIAVQCWGDNNTITITNSKLICNYTTNAQYTSYCVVLQDDGTYKAENNTLVIDNCEFLYSGIDNFNSSIYSAKDMGKGANGNTVTVTNCTYGEKVVAY